MCKSSSFAPDRRPSEKTLLQTMSSNWSCILYDEQIVIHSEESDFAHQYFYPISLLQQHNKPSSTAPSFAPTLSARVSPSLTMTAAFIFPTHVHDTTSTMSSTSDEGDAHTQPEPTIEAGADVEPPIDALADAVEEAPRETVRSPAVNPNPFPFPPWYPESAHFVRQWWPTLPTIPKLSCTVVLLADHDPESHRTRYVLAQHYFKVPLFDVDSSRTNSSSQPDAESASGSSRSSSDSVTVTVSSSTEASADSMMKIWYVSQPFEVVCVLDGVEDDGEDGQGPTERPRPLMAVDFGHAVWVEYIDPEEKEGDIDEKRLRFVSFPPLEMERDGLFDADGDRWDHESTRDVEGVVRTLQIPEELNLDTVETINIDQSQGAVIISVKDGRIFILCYE